MDQLISIRDLKVHFDLSAGGAIARLLGRATDRVVHAVDGVTLDIYKGETLGLVGESGCGKTTTGRAILRLVGPTAGELLYHNRGSVDLAKLSSGRMRPFRRHVQMIFQ